MDVARLFCVNCMFVLMLVLTQTRTDTGAAAATTPFTHEATTTSVQMGSASAGQILKPQHPAPNAPEVSAPSSSSTNTAPRTTLLPSPPSAIRSRATPPQNSPTTSTENAHPPTEVASETEKKSPTATTPSTLTSHFSQSSSSSPPLSTESIAPTASLTGKPLAATATSKVGESSAVTSTTTPERMTTSAFTSAAGMADIKTVVKVGVTSSPSLQEKPLVPDPPLGLTVTEVSATWVVITWAPALSATATGVNYTLAVLDMGFWGEAPVFDNDNSFMFDLQALSTNITELTPYWRYNVTARACVNSLCSDVTGLHAFAETMPSAPGGAANLQAEPWGNASGTHAVLRWSCPLERDRHTRIIGFLTKAVLLTPRGNLECEHLTRYIPTEPDAGCHGSFSRVFPVVREFQYIFQVRTLGTDYNGTEWQTTPTYIAPFGKSEPPTDLEVIILTPSSVQLSWAKPKVTNGRLLFYYIGVFNASSISVQWLTVNVSQDDNPHTDRLIAEDLCLGTHAAPGEVPPLTQTVNVTMLLPDTPYSVAVYPTTRAGYGQLAAVDVHTPQLNYPTSFHVNQTGSNDSALDIRWTPPVPCPGLLTSYTLSISRMKDTGDAFEKDRPDRHFQGWDNSGTVLMGLRSGWVYYLLLSVTSGHDQKSLQLNVTTPESQPGTVQNLRARPVSGSYRKLRVAWDLPPILERHGHIRSFSIYYESAIRNISLQYDINDAKCDVTSFLQEFCVCLTLHPGTQYKITVSANNAHFGKESAVIAKTDIGPPPAIAMAPSLPWGSSESSQTTFRVSFCASCLVNDTNGEIIYAALVVCSFNDCNIVNNSDLAIVQSVQSLATWFAAKRNNFNTLYRPTDDMWHYTVRVHNIANKPFRAGDNQHPLTTNDTILTTPMTGGTTGPLPDVKWTSAPRTGVNLTGRPTSGPARTSGVLMMDFVVGADNGCGSKPRTDHCNGPLPPGRNFRVLMVSCTSVGCSASALSPLLYTLPTSEDFPTMTLLASLLGVTTGIVVVLLIIWCRRRQQRISRKNENVDDPPEPEEKAESVHTSGIPMHEFRDRLREWKAGPRSEDGLPSRLVQQFSKLKSVSPDNGKLAAQLDPNKPKNRYTNILPYDHSRVKLIPLKEDEPNTDYINANFIVGYHSKREYIATQGPLARTVGDFWRMVFEQKAPVIVMLSALTEGRLEKVYQYYPDDDQINVPCTCGMVSVTLLALQRHDDYLVRSFRITVGRQHHTVRQFVIATWKDFEANLNPGLMIDFLRAVRQAVPPDNKHPIVVHCSAGVGRTGTFIAIDYFANYIRQHPPTAAIDVYDFVLQMRDCRLWMVQSVEQYAFIHDVVAELIRRKMEGDRNDHLSVSTPQRGPGSLSTADSDSESAEGNRGPTSSSDAHADVTGSDVTVSDTPCAPANSSANNHDRWTDRSHQRRSSIPSERDRRSVRTKPTTGQPLSAPGCSGLWDRRSARRHSMPNSGPANGKGRRRAPKAPDRETSM